MAREVQRTVLPIPERRRRGPTAVDAKDPENRFDPIEPLRPPDGAPNVLIVLLDDVGFGASTAFGGPVAMPTAERLAASSEGSRFTGRIDWVQIDIDAAAADEDHLVSPEERLRIAMARR